MLRLSGDLNHSNVVSSCVCLCGEVEASDVRVHLNPVPLKVSHPNDTLQHLGLRDLCDCACSAAMLMRALLMV